MQQQRSCHTKRCPVRSEKKKVAGAIHKNKRATRIKLQRDRAVNEVEYLACDELYRTQLLNQVAHAEHLPVIKKRKGTLMERIKKRIADEAKNAEEELLALLNPSPRGT